jgi:hypothetical protein
MGLKFLWECALRHPSDMHVTGGAGTSSMKDLGT